MPALRWGPASYHPCKTNFRVAEALAGGCGPRECRLLCIWVSFKVSFSFTSRSRGSHLRRCAEKIQTLSQVWFRLELSLTGCSSPASCCGSGRVELLGPQPLRVCGRVFVTFQRLVDAVGRTLCVHTCACVHAQPWRLDDYLQPPERSRRS